MSIRTNRINCARTAQPQLTSEMRRLNHFAPALLTRIRQSVFQVTLRFTNDALVFASELGETSYEDGRFLARTFRRAGIVSLTLREFPSQAELSQIKQLLESASTGDLNAVLAVRSDRPAGVESIAYLPPDSAAGQEIPGHFKHYTSHANYQEIMARREIAARPHSKNGEVREGIYLTRLSLSRQEAFETIFIGNPLYADRSTHVIGFDVLDAGLRERIRQNGIESFLEEGISLNDRRIQVRYQGPNYLRGNAAA